jgi:hypothetical protein
MVTCPACDGTGMWTEASESAGFINVKRLAMLTVALGATRGAGSLPGVRWDRFYVESQQGLKL